MNGSISYEELRKFQIIERENKNLQYIPEDFFKNIIEYIIQKENLIRENKNSDNLFARQTSEKNEQELRNIRKILADICSRRRKKIVHQALTDIYARVQNTENMLSEEEEIYNKVLEISKDYEGKFLKRFDESEIPETPETESEEKEQEIKVVMLEDVPEFMWEEKIMGPFEKDQVVTLSKKLADFFSSGQRAKYLE